MGFFTTNWGLGNAFNNPSTGRTQPFMPGAGSLSSTQNLNPFQWTPQPSGQNQTNWGAPNTAAGTGNSYNFAGTVGNQNPFAPQYQGFGQQGNWNSQPPWWQNQQNQQPPKPYQQRGMLYPSSAGGSDYEDSPRDPNASFNSTQGYLNAPEWQRDMTAALVPFGLGTSFARGINQDGTTKSWYEGSTDAYGNAYLGGAAGNKSVGASERNLGRDFYGNTLASYKMDKDMLDGQSWGDYYNQAKNERAAVDATGVNSPGMFGGWFTQDPNNVEIVDGKPYSDWQAEEKSALQDFRGTANFTPFEGQGWNQFTPATPEQEKNFDKNWDQFGGAVLENYDNTADNGGWSSVDTSEGTTAGDYAEAGFSQEDADFANSGFDDDSSSDSGGGSSGGGGSYIATAATQALGEEGLKTFEDWRDYMFTWHPTFTTSFGRYRATAPKIVNQINKTENPKGIYNYIWDMHLKPIFDLISKDRDSEKALKDYKTMVRELSNKFLKEKA